MLYLLYTGRCLMKSRSKREVKRIKPKGKKQKHLLPISDEVRTILEQQRELFRQKFGRDPGPGDPIFFDPDMNTPDPIDMDAEWQAAIEEYRQLQRVGKFN